METYRSKKPIQIINQLALALKDEQIVEENLFYDVIGMMSQLGIKWPSPA